MKKKIYCLMVILIIIGISISCNSKENIKSTSKGNVEVEKDSSEKLDNSKIEDKNNNNNIDINENDKKDIENDKEEYLNIEKEDNQDIVKEENTDKTEKDNEDIAVDDNKDIVVEDEDEKSNNKDIEESTDIEESKDIIEQIEFIVNNEINKSSGTYSVAFKDFNTGKSTSINNSKTKSASTIKIFIIIELYNQVRDGKIDLNQVITITKDMIVGGAGIIQNNPVGSTYTINELMNLMMTKSDNTATNIIMDIVGIKNINTTISNLGCRSTALNRKMMDFNAINNGLDNYTSVTDLLNVLDKLYNSNCVGSGYDEKIIDIMKQHQLKTKIPSKLPSNVVVAHKSGELGGVENDAGIVFTSKGAYILSITSREGGNSQEITTISNISKRIYDIYIAY